MAMLRGGALTVAGGVLVAPEPSWPDPEPGWTPPPPPEWQPDPDPGPDPVPLPRQPGTRGTEWALLVCEFPSGRPRGVIWDAQIDKVARHTYGAGPASMNASIPSTTDNLAILGRDPLRVEFAVCVDGRVLERYVMRQPWSYEGATVRIEGQTYDVLLGERVIGPPGRRNWVPALKAGLPGWHRRGGASAQVYAGGPAGTHFVRVSGPVGSYVAAAVRLTVPGARWVPVTVGAASLVRVPNGDWDRYQLVSVHIWDYQRGRWAWPPADGTTDGEFSDSMERGEWLADEIQVTGLTPPIPFDVRVELRLHALGSGASVDYAAPVISTPGYDGLLFPPGAVPDLSHVISWLLAQAQDTSSARQKSSWNLPADVISNCGTRENTVWQHGNRLPLTEALSQIVERDDGPDVWADGAKRRFAISRRRGRRRLDLAIYPWDVLEETPRWRHDPGAQVTGLHVLSASSHQFGGGDVGITDTSRAGGQVIEATVQSPDGLTRNQMTRWGHGKLQTLRHPQITTTVLVPWELGRLLAIGDSVPTYLVAGAADLGAELRVTSWTALPNRDAVELGLGTDPQRGV